MLDHRHEVARIADVIDVGRGIRLRPSGSGKSAMPVGGGATSSCAVMKCDPSPQSRRRASAASEVGPEALRIRPVEGADFVVRKRQADRLDLRPVGQVGVDGLANGPDGTRVPVPETLTEAMPGQRNSIAYWASATTIGREWHSVDVDRLHGDAAGRRDTTAANTT